MKGLCQRLTQLEADGTLYELDFITMRGGGFVYRNARVTRHDEQSIFITQVDREGETYLRLTEIASARIIVK